MDLFSVLVTGANRGIGLEFIHQLAQLNPPPKHIFATYRSENAIQELTVIQNTFQSKTKIHLIQMDVTKEEDINNAAKIVENNVKDAGLTLLINNAGFIQPQAFPQITTEMLHLHFSTNAIAPLLITQVFYSLLKRSAENRNGRNMGFSRAGILNISSTSGSLTYTGRLPPDLKALPYKVSKAALNMGMRVIASDSKKDNIIVITLCPGWVNTTMGNVVNADEVYESMAKLGVYQIEPNESVSAILNTLTELNETHHGTYIERSGKIIPY